ncbi:hypothetical protein JL720_15935 [Aureococcus anophagefferens]|nr:hypothetical protein JL720_15935 [Aureococcus anophagefferens]
MAVRQGWLRIAVLSLCVAPSSSTGKGPVGIFAVDATHVVITDSNFAALFAVDTRASRRVGDFFWPVDRYNRPRTNTTRKQDWVSPTGVGSCAACATAWVSSNGNDEKPSFWRVDLARPLAAMAQTGTFDELASSRVVARPVDGRGVARLADAGHGPSLNASLRMVAIAPNGRDGYVAAMGYGVLVFDATDAADGGLLPVAQLRPRRGDEFELRITALSGLQFSSDDGSALLATDEASFLRLADVRTVPYAQDLWGGASRRAGAGAAGGRRRAGVARRALRRRARGLRARRRDLCGLGGLPAASGLGARSGRRPAAANARFAAPETDYALFWTREPCASCWLRNPGECDPFDVDRPYPLNPGTPRRPGATAAGSPRSSRGRHPRVPRLGPGAAAGLPVCCPRGD